MNWTGKTAGSEAQAAYNKHLATAGQSVAAPVTTAPVEEKKEEKKAPAKPVAKAAVPKEPVKVLRFKTWEISNYGDETIEFAAEEVNPGMTFNFFNCTKTKVIVNGKCKNLMLSRCKKVDITVDNAMSMMEVVKCEDCKVHITTKLPSISVEVSNGIQIFTTEASKNSLSISTTASQSVSLNYPKDEGTFDPNDEEAESTA